MSKATDTPFPALLEALRARLDLVADRAFYERDAAGHLAALRNATGRLDEIISRLPADTDPHLRHYLSNQSYLKAVAWLESQ